MILLDEASSNLLLNEYYSYLVVDEASSSFSLDDESSEDRPLIVIVLSKDIFSVDPSFICSGNEDGDFFEFLNYLLFLGFFLKLNKHTSIF